MSMRIAKLIFIVSLISAACKNRTFPEIIRVKDKFGLISNGNDTIIPPLYDKVIIGYHPSLIILDSADKEGLCDFRGKSTTACTYEFIQPPDINGLHHAFYRDSSLNMLLCTLLDNSGKPRFNKRVRYIGTHSDGMYTLTDPGNYSALADKKGRILTQFKYKDLYCLNDSLICIKNSQNKWGVINSEGLIRIPAIYEDMDRDPLNHELLKVKKDKKIGYINIKNQIVIPIKYQEIFFFRDRLAFACEKDKGGYIDEKNQIKIPFEYERHTDPDFHKGRAIAIKNKKYGLIDTTGKNLTPFAFDMIYRKGEEFYWQIYSLSNPYSDSLFGFMDLNGKITSSYPSAGQDIVMSGKEQELEAFLKKYNPGIDSFNLNMLLNTQLKSLFNTANSYKERENFSSVLISHGLLYDNGIFYEKNNYLLKWQLLQTLKKDSAFYEYWTISQPEYKRLYQSLSSYDQTKFKDILLHLQSYLKNYNLKKTTDYLIREPQQFAHLNPDGSMNPYRKAEAFLDRLIIIHKVSTAAQLLNILNLIVADLEKW